MLQSRKRVLVTSENASVQKKRRASMNVKSLKKVSTETGSKIKVMLRCKANNNIKGTPSTLEPVSNAPDTKILLKTNNTIYSFDRVFDQYATQEKIYEAVADPVLKEVLKGYSCTIFAYGQTGTGKTYTMEGDLSEDEGGHGRNAGIIPRTIRQLFLELKNRDPENHVMVSMLELYNEELRDLLCFSDEPKPLNIFEDGTGVVVQGIKEHAITSVERGLEMMKSGVKKRMTASTNINDKSSRSHSIFTITVYLREAAANGEKTFRVGKLNLVDLAGSENSRSSGSEQLRAREAANINRSLLTLGRVINSLVDKTPHIPYRESKLTRLLKDSLGGHTKTYIIATVSPEQQTLEEIRSTLDYASHATGICNRPQTNVPISSEKHVATLIRSMEQMDNDLQMNYDRNGVYQTKKVYDATRFELQSTKEALQAKEAENHNLRNIEKVIKEQSKLAAEEYKYTIRELETALEVKTKEQREFESKQRKVQHHMQKEFNLRLSEVEAEAKAKKQALFTEFNLQLSQANEENNQLKNRHLELVQSIASLKNDVIAAVSSKWQSFMSNK
ncbi:hypothetical protein HPULCUR_007326 [Helicostylum pulchrum]|uniref:Kinesin-like protein n=1 Tax=Helicostylum pulchrum TaxID=562976 RepID=A0ABP9Y4F2_9FUNG